MTEIHYILPATRIFSRHSKHVTPCAEYVSWRFISQHLGSWWEYQTIIFKTARWL